MQFPGTRAFPRKRLGTWPTPVLSLPRVGASIGFESLWMKNDGQSGKIYGGNKVRKLEFSIGEAIEQGAEAVLTFGAAGSHHALATTVYARQSGLRSIAILTDQPTSSHVKQNLLLQREFGAELHYCEHFSHFGRCAARLRESERARSGREPYVIAPGGSSSCGALGYVSAAFELEEQVSSGLLPRPDVIYVPLGTTGTAVGLLIGLRAMGWNTRVECIRVVDKDYASFRRCMDLASETIALLRSLDDTFPEVKLEPGDFSIRHEFYGQDYGTVTAEGLEAIFMMDKMENVELERTYTAKTFAAVIDDARTGMLHDLTALYWHTYNSAELPDISEKLYRELPASFHRFFE